MRHYEFLLHKAIQELEDLKFIGPGFKGALDKLIDAALEEAHQAGVEDAR